MEYIKSSLSGFYKECTFNILAPWATENTLDEFGIGFALYVEYMIFIKKIQLLMPSWIKFSNYQSEHKEIAFNQIFAKAPGSPLYWFCAIDLECTKFLNKRKNAPTVADIYEVINCGISSSHSRKNFPIKFLNTNLPADTEETNLLKAEVRMLLENKKLLSATVEYAYYLSCLHERLGVTDKRKSWFKKNINYILDSYEKYLYILRRTFVVIERRKRKKQELESAHNEFHGQDWKLQERQGRHGESDVQNLAFSGQESRIALEDKESSFQWKCLENNIFIQSQHDNPNNLILLNKADALSQIDKHLSKKRMDSMITPEIVLSVLDYYMQVCSQGLQDRLSLQVDDVIWSKISKGKIRLLVRTVPTGLVFHVYKRKDFVSSMFD